MSSAEIPVREPHHDEPDDKPSAGPLDPIEPEADAEIVGSSHLSLVKPVDEPDWRLDQRTVDIGREGVQRARAELAASGDVRARLRAQEQAKRQGQRIELTPPPIPPRVKQPDQEENRAS